MQHCASHRRGSGPRLHTANVLQSKVFPALTWEGHQLFGMARRVLPAALASPLVRLDAAVLPVVPILRNLCRYVVVVLPRG